MGTRADDPLVDRLVHGVESIGWVGVDLFFVLSGFLITGILLDAKGTAGAFPRFWKRRALRIFPLYYAACAFFFFVLPRIGYFAGDPATATGSYCLNVVHYPFIMMLDLLVRKFRIAPMCGSRLPEWGATVSCCGESRGSVGELAGAEGAEVVVEGRSGVSFRLAKSVEGVW